MNQRLYALLNIHYGFLEFLLIPFSLTNARTTFCCLMDYIVHEYINDFVVVHLNDVVFLSESLQEHIYHLKRCFVS